MLDASLAFGSFGTYGVGFGSMWPAVMVVWDLVNWVNGLQLQIQGCLNLYS